MSPDLEQALVKKVDEIHAALVGPLGIEENGIIYKVNNHDKRITALERWRWYLMGGVVAIVGLLRMLFKAI